MFVALPSLEEIREIVARLDYFLALAEAAEREYVDADLAQSKLRQSILKAAFEGRLVPQDPRDEPASVLLARLQERSAGTHASRERRGGKRDRSETPDLPLFGAAGRSAQGLGSR
jgi:type I restriction enzyme, S subunit